MIKELRCLSVIPFLGSGPKGPMSCRTQGWISLRPSVRTSVRPSVRPPPWGHLGPNLALSGLKLVLWGPDGQQGGMNGRMDGRTDGRKDRRKEIHPCVLQDIGPLGPLPKKPEWRILFHDGFKHWYSEWTTFLSSPDLTTFPIKRCFRFNHISDFSGPKFL